MNKTIEISTQAARDMVPCLESKLEWLNDQIETFLSQRDSVKTTLAEVIAKLNGKDLPLINGKAPQRFPKGHGEKVIFDLLFTLPPGKGLKMAEIEERTGINHATVYRVLTKPERNQGRFVKEQGVWQIAPPKK